MQQLQTTTNQDYQVGFDENIISILVFEMYKSEDFPQTNTSVILDTKDWKFPLELQTEKVSVTGRVNDLSSSLNRIVYRDPTLAEKMIRLINNIGSRLFNKLNEEQKILMARTAGSIEFGRKIDIDSVYNYIDTYEV